MSIAQSCKTNGALKSGERASLKLGELGIPILRGVAYKVSDAGPVVGEHGALADHKGLQLQVAARQKVQAAVAQVGTPCGHTRMVLTYIIW